MTLIVEAILTGVLTGSVYALMASGLTLTFGVMEIINIAQGILVILGAYLSYAFESSLHLDLFVTLLVSMPLLFLLGIGIYVVVLRRLKQDRTTLSILATFAIALAIEGALTFVFTTNDQALHAWYVDASVPIADFRLPYIYLFAFLLSVVLLTALYLLVYRTTFGAALRASMQNRTAATLIGINVERVQAITFGLSTALAATGGMVYGAINVFNPASSYDLISRLLVIIVFGGMGSLQGALIASLLMLVIGDVTAVIWSPVWSSTVFFGLLVILLVIRPQGILGRKMGREQ